MEKYMKANIVFSKFIRNYMEFKKDLPIRPSEMGVLNIIVQRDGMFTPLMIAELLEVSKPMVTAHITALEEKGYIFKEYSKEDKRSFYVIPTDKAKKLVEKTAETMNGYLYQIESALGEDAFNQLTETIARTNKLLKEINNGY